MTSGGCCNKDNKMADMYPQVHKPPNLEFWKAKLMGKKLVALRVQIKDDKKEVLFTLFLHNVLKSNFKYVFMLCIYSSKSGILEKLA
jgi:hypothetical protein